MIFARYSVVFATIAVLALSAQERDQEQIAGTWRGESSCAVKETACHDETVVYRFLKIPEKPGYFSISADKIVDGKAVNMGTLEFQYREDQHELVCDYAQGVWRLKVDGAKMDGTLTRADNTIFRRVTLRKDP